MTEPTGRSWQVFLEVFEALPRQGPGDRASTARALRSCEGLGPNPTVVDLGCGSGTQTIDVADLTGGTVVAVDTHAPFLARLAHHTARRGVGDRVHPMVADMGSTGLLPDRFDLVWSEGALYQLGLDRSLAVCCSLVRAGGFVVFTDAVWRRSHPPAEVQAIFDADYPGMGTVADDLSAIARSGLEVIDHFPLPDEAWWNDFYSPLLEQVHRLRPVHRGDPEALAVLDQLEAEAAAHRRFGHHYGYEFFISRRPVPAPS